jgi:hypothetical protein
VHISSASGFCLSAPFEYSYGSCRRLLVLPAAALRLRVSHGRILMRTLGGF